MFLCASSATDMLMISLIHLRDDSGVQLVLLTHLALVISLGINDVISGNCFPLLPEGPTSYILCVIVLL